MTVDEIREKYHCDKRQTGQNFVTNWGSGASFESGIGRPPRMNVNSFKKSVREDNKPGVDPLIKARNNREKNALILKIKNGRQQIKDLENKVKSMEKELFEKYKVLSF